ncbi:hypothetical protein Tco_0334060, partial [Tanacetum coccineum]
MNDSSLFKTSLSLPSTPQLLLDENRLNLKSFKDKLPPNIDENPYFQHLEMDFRNFIYTEDDDDLAFLPKEPSLGFGTG